jgi:hypothetical protein
LKLTQTQLRLLGISGALGGLILFAGDLLFYYDSIHVNIVQNMGNASDNRIIISGVTALFATWFYLIGLISVYFAFKPSSNLSRNLVIGSFASILVSYGIIHGAYMAIATTAKLAIDYQIDIETATELAIKANHTLRWFVYPLFALLSIVFITQVWKRKTHYPRWIILFFPLIPFLFQGLLSKALRGTTYWIIFVGGFLNLILVLFFVASTVALWRKR